MTDAMFRLAKKAAADVIAAHRTRRSTTAVVVDAIERAVPLDPRVQAVVMAIEREAAMFDRMAEIARRKADSTSSEEQRSLQQAWTTSAARTRIALEDFKETLT